jgi:hypothetical protein
VYPQGNPPDSWPQSNQQPDPYAAYGQQPDPYAAYGQQPDPYAAYGQPPQSVPQYPAAPYQQPGGYPVQPYPAPVQGRRSGSRTPLIILGVVGGVIALVCAVGVFLVALGAAVDDDSDTDRAGASASAEPPAPTQTTTPTTPGPTGSPTEESIEGDLAGFKVGDCLTITGTENSVNPAKCTDSGAYKVLLRRDGTTDQKVCDGTDATDFLYQDGVGTSRDLVLCVAPAK